eukprot:gene3376-5923_t
MSFFGGFLSGITRATDMLSGAIDIVVVKQPDGSFRSTPFHVRFGALKLYNSSEKKVRIMINGKLTDVCMKVGDAGEVFFVQETSGPVTNKSIITSPIIDLSPKYEEEDTFDLNEDFIDVDLSQLDFEDTVAPISARKRPSISDFPPKTVEEAKILEKKLNVALDAIEKEEQDELLEEEIKNNVNKKEESNSYWFWGKLPSWFGFKEENSLDIKKKNDFIEQQYLETLEKEYGHYKEDTKIINLRNLLEEETEEEETKKENVVPVTTGNETSPNQKVISSTPSSSKTLSPESTTPTKVLSPLQQVSPKKLSPALKLDFKNESNLKNLTPSLPPSMTPQSSPKPNEKTKQENTDELVVKESTNSWKRWLFVDTSKDNEPTFEKSVYPTSEQINSLGLKDGKNEIKFIVSSRVQGPQEIVAQIYLWNHDTKIVISDIDGTITKSDALGHILPMMGKDWSHSGIAGLYTNIEKNGYKILYLTSRSILQAGATRGYIDSVKQEQDLDTNKHYVLPEGPIITSPEKLMQCLTREVITRNPEEFKIAALRDVQLLFPKDPFYAGFGNKINDFIAYRTVGVPIYRIFIIESTGILRVNSVLHKSYKDVNELVDMIFPDLKSKKFETGFTKV